MISCLEFTTSIFKSHTETFSGASSQYAFLPSSLAWSSAFIMFASWNLLLPAYLSEFGCSSSASASRSTQATACRPLFFDRIQIRYTNPIHKQRLLMTPNSLAINAPLVAIKNTLLLCQRHAHVRKCFLQHGMCLFVACRQRIVLISESPHNWCATCTPTDNVWKNFAAAYR